MRPFVLFSILTVSVLLLAGNLQADSTGYRGQNAVGYYSKGAFHFSHSPHVQNSSEKYSRRASYSGTRTYVIDRSTHRQSYHDGRGRLYYNTETVITYKKVYPDGRYKVYSRTYAGY